MVMTGKETAMLDELKLENQVCFSLYSASNAVIRAYRPLLEPLGITYLQYMAMMVLWQRSPLTVKQLGEQLHLDSGTLTPLLKRLQEKGLVLRRRDENDERVRQISLTEAGQALHDRARQVPAQLACQLEVCRDDALLLKQMCDQLLAAAGKK